MKNKEQTKDKSTGKFKPVVKPSTEIKTTFDLVFALQQELYAGSTDLEKIKNTYQLIVGNDYPASIFLMKRTIMNYGV